MRIAINSYFLLQPATGSGEHLYNLLEGLDTIDDSNRYLVMYPRLAGSGIVRSPLLGTHFHVREVDGFSSHMGLRWGKLWWEQVALRKACAAEKPNLLHSPYFASPLFPNVPTIVTVHDVIPMVLPAYRYAAHVRIYTTMVAAAARRAQAIVTVSEASKSDVVKALGVPADRVHVIYNASDPTLQPVSDEASLEGVRDIHGIAGDFLLYFGGFDVRKNVERIIRAYHAAKPSFDRPYQLVLAGSLGLAGRHPLYPDPRPLIKELGLEDSVLVTGRISADDKALLYSAATAFVFPSLYEGFGIPVLESMACGTPVITSNCSSLPEVAGDAAIQVDPTRVEEIAAAMVRMLNDPNLRYELRRRGIQRASSFSWEASAMKTLELYRKVAS